MISTWIFKHREGTVKIRYKNMAFLYRVCTMNKACRTGRSSRWGSEWWVNGKAWDVTVHVCRLHKHCRTSPPPLPSHRGRNRTPKLSMLVHKQVYRPDWLEISRRNWLGKEEIPTIVTARREWKVAWGSLWIRNINGEIKEHSSVSWRCGFGCCMLK